MNSFLRNNTGTLVLSGVGLYLIYKLKTGTFSELLGIKGAEAQNKAQTNIHKQLENDAGVKSQSTAGNIAKAERLHKAMNHLGTDEKDIYDVLKTITGPNQMKAVYLAYGVRTNYVFGIPYDEGDLFYNLKKELGATEFNKRVSTPYEKWVYG